MRDMLVGDSDLEHFCMRTNIHVYKHTMACVQTYMCTNIHMYKHNYTHTIISSLRLKSQSDERLIT